MVPKAKGQQIQSAGPIACASLRRSGNPSVQPSVLLGPAQMVASASRKSNAGGNS